MQALAERIEALPAGDRRPEAASCWGIVVQRKDADWGLADIMLACGARLRIRLGSDGLTIETVEPAGTAARLVHADGPGLGRLAPGAASDTPDGQAALMQAVTALVLRANGVEDLVAGFGDLLVPGAPALPPPTGGAEAFGC